MKGLREKLIKLTHEAKISTPVFEATDKWCKVVCKDIADSLETVASSGVSVAKIELAKDYVTRSPLRHKDGCAWNEFADVFNEDAVDYNCIKRQEWNDAVLDVCVKLAKHWDDNYDLKRGGTIWKWEFDWSE